MAPDRAVVGLRRHLVVAGLVLAVLVSALAAGTPPSRSASTVTRADGTYTVRVAAADTCAWAYATGATPAYLVYPLADEAVTAATDLSGHRRTGTYTGGAAHSTSPACARDGDGATTFGGRGGPTAVVSPGVAAGPRAFTLEIWFRTTVPGGYLIGLSGARAGTGARHDRHLYLDRNGHVVFGVRCHRSRTVTSPGHYDDGAWHQAAATFGARTGLTLYVDGRGVGTPVTTDRGAARTRGRWRIGSGNLTGWPGSAAPYAFRGQLGYAVVYTSVLPASTIAEHHRAGS